MIKVLVVDDNSEIRQTVRRMLEKHNYEVTEAADGKECIEALEQLDPDLVITDIDMPEFDGLQVIQKLAKDNPKQKVIAMSGIPQHSQACLTVAKQVGARAILQKPFSLNNLISTVKTVIEGH